MNRMIMKSSLTDAAVAILLGVHADAITSRHCASGFGPVARDRLLRLRRLDVLQIASDRARDRHHTNHYFHEGPDPISESMVPAGIILCTWIQEHCPPARSGSFAPSRRFRACCWCFLGTRRSRGSSRSRAIISSWGAAPRLTSWMTGGFRAGIRRSRSTARGSPRPTSAARTGRSSMVRDRVERRRARSSACCGSAIRCSCRAVMSGRCSRAASRRSTGSCAGRRCQALLDEVGARGADRLAAARARRERHRQGRRGGARSIARGRGRAGR